MSPPARRSEGLRSVLRRLEAELVKPAKGDQVNTVELHSQEPEEFNVLISCADPATLDAIVNLATRMSGVRIVVENPGGGAH